MNPALDAAFALLLFGTAGLVARSRDPGLEGRGCLVTVLAGLGASALLRCLPAVHPPGSVASAVIGQWVGDVCSMVAAAGLVGLLAVNRRGGDARWGLILQGWLLITTAIVLAAPSIEMTRTLASGGVVQGTAALSYLIPFLVYLTIALGAATLRAVMRRALSAGALVGASAAVIVTATSTSLIGRAWQRIDTVHVLDTAAASSLGVVIAHAGHAALLAALWHPRVIAVVRRRRLRRCYRALDPLWVAVTRAAPSVVLPPGPSVRGVEPALYRRVIEILEGWHLLRQYVPADQRVPSSPTVPPGAFPSAAELRADACELSAGLHARLAGHAKCSPAGEPRQRFDGLDTESVARWLMAVAAAMPTDLSNHAEPSGACAQCRV